MRINISLPKDLKERMRIVRQPVNWSAIAARAFSAHLADLDNPNAQADLPLPTSPNCTVAKALGHDWAIRLSLPEELGRVATNRSALDFRFTSPGPKQSGGAERFFFVIEPESEGYVDRAHQFWELVLGSREFPDDPFVSAFVGGAMEVWEK